MTEERKITIDDVRLAGYCVTGARRWFGEHGLDFRDFIQNGINEEKFLEAGDSLAQLVVDRKKAREANNGR